MWSVAWTDAIQRDQPYLIKMVEAVKVAFMEEDFEEGTSHGDTD